MFRKLTLAATMVSMSLLAHAQSPSAEEIVDKELASHYMAGKDFTAKLSMRLFNAEGSQRERALNLWRMNIGKTGEQRYLISFDSPADVRGMAFLVWKNNKKEDDRWLYFPALKAVKRIAADDKRSSFVGSDFTYEDISGRDLEEEKHSLVRRENLGDRPAYVIESRPKSNATYARRVSWIDGERWLPLKEEYYDAQGKLQRTFKSEKVENVAGHWTVTSRSMTNNQTGHRTEVVFTGMRYDAGVAEDMFQERSLRNPPAPPQ
jgi:outer membrane lipoprotein-sorting protein